MSHGSTKGKHEVRSPFPACIRYYGNIFDPYILTELLKEAKKRGRKEGWSNEKRKKEHSGTKVCYLLTIILLSF